MAILFHFEGQLSVNVYMFYFTEQTESKGASVDRHVEPMEVEQSAHWKGDSSHSPTSPDFKRDNTSDASETLAGPPPERYPTFSSSQKSLNTHTYFK